MADPADHLALLHHLVDSYVESTSTALAAVGDEATPAPARRALVAALNYALDVLDMFPDYQALGVADDAMLLRLAARQAVSLGATHAGVRALADEAAHVDDLVGELAAPLGRYVDKLAERSVNGRTAAQIVADKSMLATFTADISHLVRGYKPRPIAANLPGDYLVKELRGMVRHELKRAGLLT